MMRFCPQRPHALLLLGPTGSGKTPLGQWLEARGWHDAPCIHFDFGENLRRIVAEDRPDETITPADLDFLRGVLAAGALLEDEQFPIAERILRSFLARHCVDDRTWMVLNGLPRHVGQAQAIDALLAVRLVVRLDCTPETVACRLESNIGGDRAGRSDDNLDRVRKKLDLFQRRTAPLVDHYRRQNVPIATIPISPTTTAEEAATLLLRNFTDV